MFRKLAFLLLSVFIIGMGLVIINTDSASSSGMESMIVLDNKAIAIEKSDQQNISVTTDIEANEVLIGSQATEYQNPNIQSTSSSVGVKKVVFDSTKYLNKNFQNNALFPPITVLYVNQLLIEKREINIQHLVSVAQSLPQTKIPVILDIEIWDVHTTDEIEANRNIDKYILVIDTMKKARPDLKFGYYGVLPNRDYWSPVSNKPEKIKEWDRINTRLKRLATHVDVVCPSVYSFYNDLDSWNKFAIENIRRAKEYGKPVYPFIWPQYHNSNPLLKGQFVSQKMWLEQLNLVYKEADGVIIWGGWNLSREHYGPMQWDENAPWWIITKQFIEKQ